MTYNRLHDRFDRIATIGEALGVLHWDLQTMMPKGGAEARSNQLAALSVISHELLIDERMSDWFSEAEEQGELSVVQRTNVSEMKRLWTHATAMSAELVGALSKAGTECLMVWQDARPANDFKAFQGPLERVLELSREVAQAKSEALGLTPYDAMIDYFDPGTRTEAVDAVFAPLRAELPGLIDEVIAAQNARGSKLPLGGPFPASAQEVLGKKLMTAIGFDFGHGRLDVSAHPFCGGSPTDIRITTRYKTDEFASALMGVLHETGHAMYEMQLPKEWSRQPVGTARGMAMHESQSLLMEKQACLSDEFLSFVTPLVHEAFNVNGEAYGAQNLAKHYRHVERGLIRVDADEVTYPLHVILRFDMERALISGDLEVRHLPDAWNEAMERLLGVTPTSDADGCMQDVHWTDGSFGYFPSYTLGAIAAAQLFEGAVKAHPGIPAALGRGDFSELLDWLRVNVHERGSTASADTILTDATGGSYDADALLTHLRRRYLAT
ncbi:MAG: carboxypeptidase Taq [Bradymonadia bacterium]|jgi:carboxypeptidase Taq